jgi:hypothetical protein
VFSVVVLQKTALAAFCPVPCHRVHLLCNTIANIEERKNTLSNKRDKAPENSVKVFAANRCKPFGTGRIVGNSRNADKNTSPGGKSVTLVGNKVYQWCRSSTEQRSETTGRLPFKAFHPGFQPLPDSPLHIIAHQSYHMRAWEGPGITEWAFRVFQEIFRVKFRGKMQLQHPLVINLRHYSGQGLRREAAPSSLFHRGEDFYAQSQRNQN